MESPVPRGEAEGTEERVLALHTEKFEEIDESASVVVGGMVSQMMSSRDKFWSALLSSLSLGHPTVKAGYMESLVPRFGAKSTEDRVLAFRNRRKFLRISPLLPLSATSTACTKFMGRILGRDGLRSRSV